MNFSFPPPPPPPPANPPPISHDEIAARGARGGRAARGSFRSRGRRGDRDGSGTRQYSSGTLHHTHTQDSYRTFQSPTWQRQQGQATVYNAPSANNAIQHPATNRRWGQQYAQNNHPYFLPHPSQPQELVPGPHSFQHARSHPSSSMFPGQNDASAPSDPVTSAYAPPMPAFAPSVPVHAPSAPSFTLPAHVHGPPTSTSVQPMPMYMGGFNGLQSRQHIPQTRSFQQNASPYFNTQGKRKPKSTDPSMTAEPCNPETAPAVPSFGLPLPTKRDDALVSQSESKLPRKKKQRKHNQLGLTPANDVLEDSDEEVDEEARYAYKDSEFKVEYKSLTTRLDSPAAIAAWVAERKKRWPTKAKVEEKERVARERREKLFGTLKHGKGKTGANHLSSKDPQALPGMNGYASDSSSSTDSSTSDTSDSSGNPDDADPDKESTKARHISPGPQPMPLQRFQEEENKEEAAEAVKYLFHTGLLV
ncbi:MAG: hypothetical protein M1821_002924 [Bathelium mastoideum]|nr:MAG: hypothetical protein M1821_002924 [Bathelium mastoideum]